MMSLAYLVWAGLNKIGSDGDNAGSVAEQPANASDHNMQDVLPAVNIVVSIAEDIGNTLQRQKI